MLDRFDTSLRRRNGRISPPGRSGTEWRDWGESSGSVDLVQSGERDRERSVWRDILAESLSRASRERERPEFN